MQHIHWLLQGTYQHQTQLYNSNLASIRMRAAVAAEACIERGISFSAGEKIPGKTTKLVVGKIGASETERRSSVWLQGIAAAKKAGCRILLDYTDHHLGYESVMRNFYQKVLPHVDDVISPTQSMVPLLGNFWNGSIKIIYDALEIEVTPPKLKGNEMKTALWFGHQSNIEYLIDFLERRLSEEKIKLRIIALTSEQGFTIFKTIGPKISQGISVEFAPWSVQNMQLAAQLCDLCIIPTNPSDLKKSGVSANRLITALALGLPTAAGNQSSYREFKPFYIDINEPTLEKMIIQPNNYHAQVVEAQQLAIPKFKKFEIKKNWINLLDHEEKSHK